MSEIMEDLEDVTEINSKDLEFNSKDPEFKSKDPEFNSKDPESNSEWHESDPIQPEINRKIGTGSKALSSSNCLLSIPSKRSQSAMSSRSKY